MSALRKVTESQRQRARANKLAAQARLRGRGATAMTIQKLRMATNVRTGGFNNIEFKFLDTVKAATAMASAGTVLDPTLLAIPQGAGESSRLGRKITVTKIDIRAVFKIFTNAITGGSAPVRFIVYQDKQTNKAAAAVSDLLVQAGAITVNAFRNLQNKDRFRVIFDDFFKMDVTAATITAADVIATQEQSEVKYYSKKVNIPIEFTSSTPDVTDLTSNNIGVIGISEAGNVSVIYSARIRYTDN